MIKYFPTLREAEIGKFLPLPKDLQGRGEINVLMKLYLQCSFFLTQLF